MKKSTLNLFCIKLFICLLCACKNSSKNIEVVFYLNTGAGQKVYLVQLPFMNEKETILDSAVIKSGSDSIKFTIADTEINRLFEIKAKGSRARFGFINDAPRIVIHGNYLTAKYTITGSPASGSLKNFKDSLVVIAERTRKIKLEKDSAEKAGNKNLFSEKDKQLQKLLMYYNEFTYSYADTVKNGAAFMEVYDLLGFLVDAKKTSNVLNNAVKRFSDYWPVQKMKKYADDIADIYAKDYNAGDMLPYISLPDVNGIPFSTATLKGKVYFIDFWSTWCPPCFAYTVPKIRAKNMFQNLEMVSVAIDSEKEDWQKAASRPELNWHQLIDTEMWQGTAVQTLKFDSIPYNFLVDKEGKILAKAIKPDSLITTIKKFVQ